MRAALVTAALLCVAPPIAAASEVPPHPLAVDVPGEGQRVVEGTGTALPVGDVNGDGAPDVAIGESSTVYVIFGPLRGSPVNPGVPGERGFIISGRSTDTSYLPDAAGDVNGDGLGDIVLAAGNPCDQLNAAFVVFGKRDTASVSLANLGTRGFRIDGSANATSDTGYCAGGRMLASGAGDFNTDGRADVVVADYGTEGVHVVFGKPGEEPVAVDSLGDAGVRFDFPLPVSLDGGLDASGDGVADVVAGGVRGFRGMPDFARVLFGGPDASMERGFSINGRTFVLNARYGESVTDLLGTSVAMVRDLNGDGLAEIALGAPNAPTLGYPAPSPNSEFGRETDFGGAVFVVFGRPTADEVDAYELGDRGYRIGGGGTERETFGGSVRAGGDINGDGLDDIVVSGTPGYPVQSSFGWAVFGKADTAPQAVAAQSRATDVPERYLEVVSASGGLLVGVGDHTGDGRGDLFVRGMLVTGPPPPLLPGACANEVVVDPRGSWFSAWSRATYATNAGDRLAGGADDDLVEALLGDDCVLGADGADVLLGGGGDDELVGGGGRDGLEGGPGADRLLGGPGTAFGKSVLDGGPGPDRVVGGGAQDRLYGGPGRDRLRGRILPDRLRGGPGRDVLIGGRAFDRIYAVDGFKDVVRCGAHRDRARIDARDRTVGCEKVQLLKPR